MNYYLVTFNGPYDTYEILVLDELPFEQIADNIFVQHKLSIIDTAKFSSTSKKLAVEFAKYVAQKDAEEISLEPRTVLITKDNLTTEIEALGDDYK